MTCRGLALGYTWPRARGCSIPYPPDRYRWTTSLLLGVGVLVNYFDRVNLSVSYAALVHDFGRAPVQL